MKRLLVLMLLSGMFVAGYYCGVNSIGLDVIAVGQDACVKAADAAERIVAMNLQ